MLEQPSREKGLHDALREARKSLIEDDKLLARVYNEPTIFDLEVKTSSQEYAEISDKDAVALVRKVRTRNGVRLEEPMLDSPEMREALKSINPLQVELDPEDHVGACLYLANKERSRGVTGIVINPDRGLGVRGLSKVAGLL